MREMVNPQHNQGPVLRSVPPRSFNYTFTDMVETQLKTRPFQTPKTRLKTAPMRTNNLNSKEYMERFKSRPLKTPRVVGFEEIEINSCEERNIRGVTGFFPPPKLKSPGGNTMMRYTPKSTEITKESILALEPTAVPPSPRPVSGKSALIRERCKSCGDTEEVGYPNVLMDEETTDLALLPKPKQVGPNRDAPWVYRYKVKKSMNHLSKIMASKPMQRQQTQEL